VLGPADTGSVVVTFAPAVAGPVTGTLTVVSDADNAPVLEIALGALGLPPLPCADDNPCTDDRFDPQTGACAFPVRSGACDDGSACTERDVCVGDRCVGEAVSCPAPAASCAAAVCDAVTGCRVLTDDDACDDGDPCTIDQCDAASGCTHSIAPDGTPCGSFALCAAIDLCVFGSCTTVTIPEDTPCDDGDLCTVNDTCGGGACTGSVTVVDPAVVDVLPAFAQPGAFSAAIADDRAVIFDRSGFGDQLSLVAAHAETLTLVHQLSLPAAEDGERVLGIDGRDALVALSSERGIAFFTAGADGLLRRGVVDAPLAAAAVLGDAGTAYAVDALSGELLRIDASDADAPTVARFPLVGGAGASGLDLDDGGATLAISARGGVTLVELQGPDPPAERTFAPAGLSLFGGATLGDGLLGMSFVQPGSANPGLLVASIADGGVRSSELLPDEAGCSLLGALAFGERLWRSNCGVTVDLGAAPAGRTLLGTQALSLSAHGPLLVVQKSDARGAELFATADRVELVPARAHGQGALGRIVRVDDDTLAVLTPSRVHRVQVGRDLRLTWAEGLPAPFSGVSLFVDPATRQGWSVPGTSSALLSSCLASFECCGALVVQAGERLGSVAAWSVVTANGALIVGIDANGFDVLSPASFVTPAPDPTACVGATFGAPPSLRVAHGFGGAPVMAATNGEVVAVVTTERGSPGSHLRVLGFRPDDVRLAEQLDGDVFGLEVSENAVLALVGDCPAFAACVDVRLRGWRLTDGGVALPIDEAVLDDVGEPPSLAFFDGRRAIVAVGTRAVFADVAGTVSIGDALTLPERVINAVAVGDRLVLATERALVAVSPPCPAP
jgi:hypothetical protein